METVLSSTGIKENESMHIFHMKVKNRVSLKRVFKMIILLKSDDTIGRKQY